MRLIHFTKDYPDEFQLKLVCAGLDFPALWVYKEPTDKDDEIKLAAGWGERNIVHLEAPDDAVELYQTFETNELYEGSPEIVEYYIRAENFSKVKLTYSQV